MKQNYIVLSIPVFFLLIGVELLVGYLKGKHYYRLNDALANLSQGIGQQLTGIFFKTILGFGYVYLYTHHRLYTFGDSLWVWVVLFLGVDFFYYWFHRLSHEVNAMWAAHIVHHQSEDYNLSVALRQSWFQGFFSTLFYFPLAIAGFEPIMFAAVSSFNTLYQFWIHTETIGKLGPLEWIFNTPSHHRVHHGSNPKYIDKNHAGSLIIWDRLFGTFQEEDEKVYYGITTPLSSWNPFWANFHYWRDLWQLSKQTTGLWNKVQVFLRPPGWMPAELGGFQHPKPIDARTYHKYNEHATQPIHRYCFFQFVYLLALATCLLLTESRLELSVKAALVAAVLLGMTATGAYFERKQWAFTLDIITYALAMVSLGLSGLPVMQAFALAALPLVAWSVYLKLNKPLQA